jgi:hypothetical protein
VQEAVEPDGAYWLAALQDTGEELLRKNKNNLLNNLVLKEIK